MIDLCQRLSHDDQFANACTNLQVALSCLMEQPSVVAGDEPSAALAVPGYFSPSTLLRLFLNRPIPRSSPVQVDDAVFVDCRAGR
jgi:hypothetical protein